MNKLRGILSVLVRHFDKVNNAFSTTNIGLENKQLNKR